MCCRRSKTVDAEEIIAHLEQRDISVTENDLDALFADDIGTGSLGDEVEGKDLNDTLHSLAHSASTRMLSGLSASKPKRPRKSLREEEFQKVILTLALGSHGGETDFAAPVRQVHLEQAMLDLKEHILLVEKRLLLVSGGIHDIKKHESKIEVGCFFQFCPLWHSFAAAAFAAAPPLAPAPCHYDPGMLFALMRMGAHTGCAQHGRGSAE